MSKLSLVLSLVVIAGCGVDAEHEPLVFACDVQPFGQVRSDVPVDCAKIRSNVELARGILTSPNSRTGKVIVPPDEFDNTFSGVPVVIRGVPYLYMDGELEVTGNYKWDVGITLSIDSDSLLHEMLHHVDKVHLNFFRLTEGGHANWEREGFNASSNEFAAVSQNMAYEYHKRVHGTYNADVD